MLRTLRRLERRVTIASEGVLATEEDGPSSLARRLAIVHLRLRTRLSVTGLRQTRFNVASAWRMACVATLRPGDTMLDLGANIGKVTELASVLVGRSGSVHSFEPSPMISRRLSARVAALGLDNVVVNQVAVGAVAGTAVLHEYLERDGGASSLRVRAELGYEEIARTSVRVVTLDDYLAKVPPSDLRMIKMDVEGSEVDVLAGAERTIARFRPVMLVEVSREANEAFGRSPDVLMDAIAGLGYLMYAWRPEGLVAVRTEVDIPTGWSHDDVLCIDPDRHQGVIADLSRR